MQRRILARSGLARYSAPSVKEKAAGRLKTTWNKIHLQWVVLWMDNWYNKQFTINPDRNDKSLNATALGVLLLRDAPRYWHGHPSLKELERRVPVVARMLRKAEGTFARILRDVGFASTRPVVRNIRARDAVWHNNAVGTVPSYFKSVSPMFKRSKRHITICNPSEAKTPVLALTPAQLHCLTSCPRYGNIRQYCGRRTCMALHTAYRRRLCRFAGRASPRETHFLLRRQMWGPIPNSSAPIVISILISLGN